MSCKLLYIKNIPWKAIGAFLVVIVFCGSAYYKEKFLLSSSDKAYYKHLEKKSKIKVSGSIIVSIIGALFAAISLFLSYIFYIKK